MARSLTRRGLVAALVAAGTGAAVGSPVNDILERIAPLSGDAYRGARGDLSGTVESPYGPATVTYDDRHVPHIEGETERAAYFAVGYVHAADRLFQMDLFRRQGAGRLSEVVGTVGGGRFVEQDVKRTKLDFRGAAGASAAAVAGTDADRMLRAYADGVNAYIDREPLGVEFELLDYAPEPWSVHDTYLVGMILNERQTFGSITAALRQQVLRRTFDTDTYRTLYPRHLGHGAPVIRDAGDRSPRSTIDDGNRSARAIDTALVDWADQLGGLDLFGSNAWVVSGEHTSTGRPMLCNDPHLPLTAPPIFYQQHVTTPQTSVRGVAFPGVPFVFVGETDHAAWGITSAPVNVGAVYAYEADGDQYRYRDDWRAFETTTETVPVRNGSDREVTVRKSIHGPVLEKEVDGRRQRVGISWVPLTGTRTAEALYEWSTADDRASFRAATRKFDAPPLHVHYADAAGRTLYQLAAKVPLRRVDGRVVPGDRVFDGSSGQGEWAGFEPYGQSSWEGFVPFEELPAAVDPDYVASANQRPVDAPAQPLGGESQFGFRARRIYERLDRAADQGRTMDRAFMRSLQLDTLDLRARRLVPAILEIRDRLSDDATPWLEALADWDYRMDRGSRAALVFDRFIEQFKQATWRDLFETRGLSRRYWPSEWVLVTLPPDSDVFDGDRAAVIATAMERTVEELDREEWEVYGDANEAAITHPLGGFVSGLNYPQVPVDGSRATVNSFFGSGGVSYRLLADPGGTSSDVLPGGNDGSVYAAHYHDQLRPWANGEYTRLDAPSADEPDVTFVRGER